MHAASNARPSLPVRILQRLLKSFGKAPQQTPPRASNLKRVLAELQTEEAEQTPPSGLELQLKLKLSSGAVYGTLHRLERLGHVESHVKHQEPGDPNRRIWTLTREGREAYQEHP